MMRPLRRAPVGFFQRVGQAAVRVLSTFGNMLAATMSNTGYDAGRWTRLTSEWTVWRRSSDQEVMADLPVLRARARNLVMNNPFAKRFVSQVRNNVVGPHGFRLKPLVRLRTGKLDQVSNDAIHAAWVKWCRKGNCTVDRRQSFVGLLKTVLTTLPQDGEVLIRLREGFDNDGRFALQAIDADLLDEQLNRDAGTYGNEIRMGVEIDQWGAPVAYHMFSRHPSESGMARARVVVPASEIIHLGIPYRVGQTRYVPWFHAIMTDLKHLDGYQEAEIVAARMAASAMGFIETQEDSAFQPTEDERVEGVEWEMEPAMIRQLPVGTKFTGWSPEHPTTAYPDFVKGVLRGISAGLDIAYHNLANDLEGVNYTSSRTGELDERDHWRDLQAYVVDDFLQVVYQRWLKMAMLTGELRLKSEDPDLFTDVAWMPRGWAWVDPEKDLNATEKALALGLTTRTREAAAMGLDFDDVLEELKEEQEKAEALGVDVGGIAAKQTANQAAAEADGKKKKGKDDGEQDDDDTADEEADDDRAGRIFHRIFERAGLLNGRRHKPRVTVVEHDGSGRPVKFTTQEAE